MSIKFFSNIKLLHLKEPKEQESADEAIKKDDKENNGTPIIGETSLDKLKRWMKKMTNKFDTAVFNGTEDSFNERQDQMRIKK